MGKWCRPRSDSTVYINFCLYLLMAFSEIKPVCSDFKVIALTGLLSYEKSLLE